MLQCHHGPKGTSWQEGSSGKILCGDLGLQFAQDRPMSCLGLIHKHIENYRLQSNRRHIRTRDTPRCVRMFQTKNHSPINTGRLFVGVNDGGQHAEPVQVHEGKAGYDECQGEGAAARSQEARELRRGPVRVIGQNAAPAQARAL